MYKLMINNIMGNEHKIKNDLDNPRIKFNWGFWAAVSDLKSNRIQQTFNPDSVYYAIGYYYGMEYFKNDPTITNSDPAWQDFKHSLTLQERHDLFIEIYKIQLGSKINLYDKPRQLTGHMIREAFSYAYGSYFGVGCFDFMEKF